MPLKKIPIKPGFNKQETATAAEGQWIDGDFVRFRYGYPEKIGGWKELSAEGLAGSARAQFTWTDLTGNKYAAIGTNKLLVIYFEGDFYDITPLAEALDPGTLTSVTGSDIVTINLINHNLNVGDYITFTNVTLPSGGVTTFTEQDFTLPVFEIQDVLSIDAFTIKMSSNEGGSGMTDDGDITTVPYVTIGSTSQTYGYGWGTDRWGQVAWGEASSTGVSLAPGAWSLDNFGQILVATVKNGSIYTWNPGVVAPLQNRAVIMSGAPTSNIATIVSDRDRHLFALGTESTIGDPTTQDPMLIRFSNQEDYNTWNPTATNTAGTFRLDTGNRIIGAVQGKDYIFVLTDQAAYVIQFVGPPFVFSVRQVGTNCGGIGLNSLIYVQGSIFWMGYGGGFFVYDGTVKQLPSLVSDFVFTTNDGNLGLNYNSADIIYCQHNSLFNEVNWFYPKANSTQIDRCVTFNFLEQVWTTMSLSRTTYQDASTYDKPYATKFVTTDVPTFPIINGVTNLNGASYYYQHEIGTNSVTYGGVESAIPAYIESGEFDISSEEGLAGDGEYLMKIRRFIPDFKYITGNAKVTLVTRDYPADSAKVIGPFTVNENTTKIDTRARNRLVSVKIENEAINENWRYGLFRLDIQSDGRR
jgi:hypothetical protein